MIQVRFVGADGRFQSIETQAVRIHKGLADFAADRVQSRLSLLPRDYFLPGGLLRKLPLRAMGALLDDVEILVVVKSSLFREFLRAAVRLKDLCRERGVYLVSNPCDGPGADGGDTADAFSEKIADYVLAVSRRQAEALAARRPAEQVLLVGHASRIETTKRLVPRPAVKRVIWENPIHHDPRFDARKVGMPRERFQELEDMIRTVLASRGAELVFIEAWRETQTYEEWERIMLDSDIAIECKALQGQYVDYQSQKPAVKVLNYMSLGLPVICDPLPAYRDLGEQDKELLFADTLAGWMDQLTRLLDDHELRVRLGAGAHKAAEPYGIEKICGRYAGFFAAMLARSRPRLATA